MSRLWALIRREYFERVRRRSFLLGTILVPVFILGFTFVPLWVASRTMGKPVHLAVVDHTAALQGSLEYSFSDSLPDGTPRFRFDWMPGSATSDSNAVRQRLREDVLAGAYTGYLWIPQDALTGGTVNLYALGSSDPEVEGRMQAAISRAAMTARLVQRGIAAEETQAISKAVPLKMFKLTKEGASEGGFERDFGKMLLFSMILYMTVLLYGVQVQRSIIEEKNSRIVEILLSSARPFQLMVGKIVGIGAVGVTQYAIWGIVASLGAAYIKSTNPAFAAAAAIPPNVFFYFVVYFLLGYFLYAALYAATGAMSTTDQDAQQMQWPISTLIAIPILLMTMIMRNPDGTLSTVLSLIPFFSPMLMMMRISLNMPPIWQIAASMAILVCSVIGLAAISARIFRVGILMYGKRPTLPEVMRWMRQG